MNTFSRIILAVLILAISPAVIAQSEDEELKLQALEALIAAPPERALPIVTKVLQGSGSDELKSRALFVASQIKRPEARQLLVDTARTGSDELRHQAVRMIGISGDEQAMAGLADIYAGGDSDTKAAVIEAYLIADDAQAVYVIAANAEDAVEFEQAVHALGAMNARDELRQLRDNAGLSEVLVQAYAVSGDVDTLRALAQDDSDPVTQLQAIHGLGIAGDDDAGALLADIYRNSDSSSVKDAALQGMLIAGHDEGVLELYRASQDKDEKRQLLEMLVAMDSDGVWDIIDATLENGQ